MLQKKKKKNMDFFEGWMSVYCISIASSKNLNLKSDNLHHTKKTIKYKKEVMKNTEKKLGKRMFYFLGPKHLFLGYLNDGLRHS